MTLTRSTIIILIILLITYHSKAQEDLLAGIDIPEEEAYVAATFKGTRLINGHSVETRKKNVLDFIVSHRFGEINSGAYEFFGLDNASIRLGLDYAITDRFSVGIGRSTYEKTIDGFLKYRLLRQQTTGMPLSLTVFASSAYKTLKITGEDLSFTERMANTAQLLLARKMGSRLSLQVMPTFIHFNLIGANDDNNDVIAVGGGGRYKITQRVSLNAEYYYQVQPLNSNTHNAIAIGVDIETGGHVFQLHLTNATAMFAKGFIAETTNDFFDGSIHYGFNISRTFQLK